MIPIEIEIEIVAVMFMALKRYIITRDYITIYKIQDTRYLWTFYLQVSTYYNNKQYQYTITTSWMNSKIIGSMQVARFKLCFDL